jgi:hypothetical protein
MDAALNVKFGADTSGLIAGLKTAEQATNGLKTSLQSVNEKFVIQNNTLNQSVGYMRQQREAAERLAAAEKDIAGSSIAASAGIEEIGASSRGILEPLNNAYNAIRKIAYVLPGIGIGGIVSLLFSGVASALTSVGSSEKVVDDATAALEQYKKTVDSVVESNSKESATVDILVAKIQSGTLSREGTVQAIKELQQIAPDYFGKLNAEKTSIEEVTKAYGNYNNALVQTIETQIKIAEITDIVKQRLAQSTATPEAAKFIADLQAQGKSLQEINAIVTKGIGEDISANAKLLDGEKKITDEQLKQSLLQSSIPAGVQTILKFLQQEADIVKDINNVSNIVKLPEVSGDPLAKTRQALEEIIRLENDLGKPDTKPLFQKLAESLDSSRAQLLETKIAEVLRDNVKNGIAQSITDKEVALLYEQLRRLLNPDLTTKIDTKIEVDPHVKLVAEAFSVVGDIGPQLDAVLKKLPPLKTDIKVDPTIIANGAKMVKEIKDIYHAIADAAVNLGEGVAEQIGQALAGVKNPFAGFLALLGDAIESFGKQLVAIGITALLAQEALKSLFSNPTLAIIAGGLAIVLGAELKALSSKKGVKAFAEGGIVTGPTNALIGEAGPEVVFPLDKLNRFLKGNTQNSRVEVVGQTVISGPNLLTVFKRATTNQRLV